MGRRIVGKRTGYTISFSTGDLNWDMKIHWCPGDEWEKGGGITGNVPGFAHNLLPAFPCFVADMPGFFFLF